jgi:hypothetical protein
MATTLLAFTALFTTLASANANLYDLSGVDIDGNNVSFSQYKGNVSLVVNVATF